MSTETTGTQTPQCEEVAKSESNTDSKPEAKPVKKVYGSFEKNWDKIAKDLGADEEESEDAEKLFKKLYAGADEATRRAMNKSYVESNGTTLSMDWKSVGKKTVKPYKEKGSDDESSSSSSDDEEEREGFRRINMNDIRNKH